MKIPKIKSLSLILALSLAMSTCSSQAFWPMQLIKKGFSTFKALGTGKKLALSVTVAAVALAVVYAIFKLKSSTNQPDPNPDPDNALLRACESGNLDEVKRLHKQGTNLKHKHREHVSLPALTLTSLLKNSNLGCDKYVTPMCIAVANGHVEVIKFLLDHGVGIESNIYGESLIEETPLSVAIESENFDSVRCLVENGANVNSSNGIPPLLKAISPGLSGNVKNNIVNHLVDNGAFIPEKLMPSDRGKRILFTKYLSKVTKKYAQYSGMFKSETPQDLLTTVLYFNSLTLTNELEDMLEDEECPCCLKQRALAVLIGRYKQNDPSLSSRRQKLTELFGSMPFNENFLKDLHKVKAIKFIVVNNITDKFERNAVTACTQCCKDEDLIDAILANHFPQFGAQVETHPANSVRDLKALFSPEEEEEGEKGAFEEMLQYTKGRNKKVYGQLLSRSYIYAQLGRTELPSELSSHIVGFLDGQSTSEVVDKIGIL